MLNHPKSQGGFMLAEDSDSQYVNLGGTVSNIRYEDVRPERRTSVRNGSYIEALKGSDKLTQHCTRPSLELSRFPVSSGS
jgi:hypothetical protein